MSQVINESEILQILYAVEDVARKLPNVYETEAKDALKKIDSINTIVVSPALQHRLSKAKSAINDTLSEGRTWI